MLRRDVLVRRMNTQGDSQSDKRPTSEYAPTDTLCKHLPELPIMKGLYQADGIRKTQRTTNKLAAADRAKMWLPCWLFLHTCF